MKKHISHRKKSRPFNPILAELRYQEQQEIRQLRARYKNQLAIVDRLAEIPIHIGTYEFLGELFFTIAASELGKDPPNEAWVEQLKNIRNDVMELYELARAARAFRI